MRPILELSDLSISGLRAHERADLLPRFGFGECYGADAVSYFDLGIRVLVGSNPRLGYETSLYLFLYIKDGLRDRLFRGMGVPQEMSPEYRSFRGSIQLNGQDCSEVFLRAPEALITTNASSLFKLYRRQGNSVTFIRINDSLERRIHLEIDQNNVLEQIVLY
jgi:hypothetical protein